MRLRDTQMGPLAELGDTRLLAISRYWGRVGRVALRRFLATLPEILRRELYRRCGCQSIFEYAAKFASASREVVKDVLNAHRQIGQLPLWDLFAAGDVGLTVLRRIAPRVTADNAGWWAEMARECTVQEIEDLIRASELQEPRPESREIEAAEQLSVVEEVARPEATFLTPLAARILDNLLHDYARRGKTVSRSELIELALKTFAQGGRAPDPDEAREAPKAPKVRLPRVLVEVADLGMTFMRTIGGLLPLADAEAAALDSGKVPIAYQDLLARAIEAGSTAKGRTPPAIVRMAIAIRSAGRCEVGSCDRPLEEIDHLDPFSERRVHHPDRMVGLCRICHRARHNGLIDNPEDPPFLWRLIGTQQYRVLRPVDRQVQAVRLEVRQAVPG